MKRVKAPPGVVNPLKSLRAACGWTQEQLAEQAGVTRQFVIRAEQAVYSTVPVGLVETMLYDLHENDATEAELYGADTADIGALYLRYQRAVRKQQYGALNPFYPFDLPGHVHPFVEWRKYSGIDSRIGVSKRFCVHPAVIFKFEKQPHLMQHVPEDLLTALRDSGYSEELLDSFVKAYDNYKRHQRHQILVQGSDD